MVDRITGRTEAERPNMNESTQEDAIPVLTAVEAQFLYDVLCESKVPIATLVEKPGRRKSWSADDAVAAMTKLRAICGETRRHSLFGTFVARACVIEEHDPDRLIPVTEFSGRYLSWLNENHEGAIPLRRADMRRALRVFGVSFREGRTKRRCYSGIRWKTLADAEPS